MRCPVIPDRIYITWHLLSRVPCFLEAPVWSRFLFYRGHCLVETPVWSRLLFYRGPCFLEIHIWSRPLFSSGPGFLEVHVWSRLVFWRDLCLVQDHDWARPSFGTSTIGCSSKITLIRPCVHRRLLVFVPNPEKDRRPIYNCRVIVGRLLTCFIIVTKILQGP